MVILENCMAWVSANFPTRWNFSSKWQLSLFSHDLTSSMKMVLNYNIHEQPVKKRWAGWQQFYQHGSFSAVPRRDLIAVKSMWQREWTRQAAPSERKTGGRDAHPLRWKPLLYWLNFAGSSSVSVTMSITHNSFHHLPSSILKLLVINAIFLVWHNKGWAEEASHH